MKAVLKNDSTVKVESETQSACVSQKNVLSEALKAEAHHNKYIYSIHPPSPSSSSDTHPPEPYPLPLIHSPIPPQIHIPNPDSNSKSETFGGEDLKGDFKHNESQNASSTVLSQCSVSPVILEPAFSGLKVKSGSKAISKTTTIIENLCLDQASTILPFTETATQGFAPKTLITPILLRDSSSLNRSDPVEIHHNQHLINPNERDLFLRILSKHKRHPKPFDDNYVLNSSILICSDYRSIVRYSYCCIPNRVNRSGRCRLHIYCPRCAYANRQNTWQTYLPRYDETRWYFVTLSFRGALPFSPSPWKALDYWNACRAAFEQLKDQGFVKGIFTVEEIKLLSLSPLTVMPHVHAIVDADSMDQAAVECLEEAISAYRNDKGDSLELELSIKIDSIASEKSFYHRLGYMHKCIDLLSPYRSAWTAIGSDRRRAISINSNMTDFISGHFEVVKKRIKIWKTGTLNSNHPEFAGIEKAKRPQYRDYINQVAKAGNSYAIESEP